MGFGLFFAFLQVFMIYLFWEPAANSFWLRAMDFMKEYDMDIGQFYFVWACTQGLITQFLFQGFWYMCYCLEWESIEHYKSLEEPWPWNTETKEEKEEWNKLWWKTAKLYFVNMWILVPLLYSPFYTLGMEVYIDYSAEGVPNGAKMIAQVLFCMFMEDMVFSISHRVLHHPKLYPHIHKIHHEHKVTIGPAG